jgi:WD40 repeat protein
MYPRILCLKRQNLAREPETQAKGAHSFALQACVASLSGLSILGLVFLLATGTAGQGVHAARIPEPRVLPEKIGFGNCLKVSPDSTLLAVAAIDGGVSLWRIPSGQVLRKLTADNSTTVCFSNDGKQLAFGHQVYDEQKLQWRGRVTIADIATGKEIAMLDDHLMSINGLDCDPVRRMFCILSTKSFVAKLFQSEIILWDGKSKERQFTKKGIYTNLAFAGGKNIFFAVDISEDLFGGRGLRIPMDCNFSFIKSSSGQETVRLRSSAISTLAVSENRRLFATVGYKPNTGVRIWDVVKLKEIGTLPRVNDGYTIMAFGLKDRIIACAESDCSIRFWDVKTRKIIGDLRSNKHLRVESQIMSMVFTPDGKLLITATDKGVVHLWDVKDYLDERLKASTAP